MQRVSSVRLRSINVRVLFENVRRRAVLLLSGVGESGSVAAVLSS
jgi:hypothetical protein